MPKPSAGGLDKRCLTGRAICISKRTNSLTWVVGGKPQLRMDVRFGAVGTPTREGSFSIQRKERTWTSTIYHSKMPYSMFFSGGQAVHYSSDFAARGYAGASHGCVNVRNLSGIQSLFSQARTGDKVDRLPVSFCYGSHLWGGQPCRSSRTAATNPSPTTSSQVKRRTVQPSAISRLLRLRSFRKAAAPEWNA